MSNHDALYVLSFLLCVFAPAPFLGHFMAKVYRGERHLFSFLAPAERALYAAAGVKPDESMSWKGYIGALLAFNVVGIVTLYAILVLQGILPFNPRGFPGMGAALAFNTAVSFVTNTNWQAYSGEASLSYFSQAAGLAVHNFLSAATGMAVILPLARIFSAKDSKTLHWAFERFAVRSRRAESSDGKPGEAETIHRPVRPGNFWVDLTRSTLFILLPLSVVYAVFLLSQGVPQSIGDYVKAATLDGGAQTIPQGPAASQIAIKMLGSNGGGFFGVNSAHPFENPTPLSNFVELVSILLLPAAMPFLFGELIGRRKQGAALFGAMAILFALGTIVAVAAEKPDAAVVWEGKEIRIGVLASTLWAATTTAVSNGSVAAMHGSMSPLAGLVELVNMMLGEVVFGGVGAGLYGLFVFALLTVFIAGLMVGRGPEFMGKKIESREVQLAMIAVILPSFVILGGTSLALLVPDGRAAILNAGPRGFSEVLYAFSSAAANNGSAFAGLAAGKTFYCIALGVAMVIGRFGVIVPVLLIGEALSVKKTVPSGAGTFRTDTALFASLLAAIVLIVGGLTFFPALTLGPVVEHFLLASGALF
jgi:K+-transporting ATPase ATPase A chain